MAQYAYPTSDISTGSWGSTPLYGYIDEVTPIDADYITSSKNPSNDTFECKFGSTITDPGVHTGHVLRVRLKDDKNTGTIDLYLYQGTTLIASNTGITVNSSFAEYTINLAEGEAANITDYTDLRVRAVANGVANNFLYCSWARMETPDGVSYVTLSGTAAGSGDTSAGSPKRTRALSGAIAGAATVLALLSPVRGISGSAAGAGDATANLKRIRSVAGSVAGSGDASADVTVTAVTGEVKPVSGSAAGSGGASAALSVTRGLAGSAAGSGDASAAAKATRRLAGSAAGAGEAAGDVTVTGAAIEMAGISEGNDLYIQSGEDGELDEWLSATNLTVWSEYPAGASTVNQESTEVYSGQYSARFDIDGSSSQVMILNMSVLENGRFYTVRFWHNTPVGNYIEFRPRVQGPQTVHYNFATGLWETAANLQVCNGTGDWKQETFRFSAHPTYTEATRLQFWVGFTDPGINYSVYLDKVELISSHGNARASLGVTRRLSGTAAGSGNATAALSVTRKLTASAAGAGSAAGALTVDGVTDVALSGTIAGQGDASAALKVGRKLTGSADGSGGATGTLKPTRGVSGSAAGSGDATGVLKVTRRLAGSAAGQGDATGDVSVTGVNEVTLSGSAAGSGNATAALKVSRRLAAATAGAGDAAGALTAGGTISLSAAVAGQGNATATLKIIRKLSGSAGGSGQATAAVTKLRPLSGSCAGAGDASAALKATRTLSAAVAGSGSVSASASVLRTLSATVSGAGDAHAALQEAYVPIVVRIEPRKYTEQIEPRLYIARLQPRVYIVRYKELK